MKNVLKVLGIIAFVAISGFSFFACGDDSGGGGEKLVPVIGVSLNTNSLLLDYDGYPKSLYDGYSQSPLYTYITPSNATNKTLIWTSSNPTVATVSDDGLVKSVASGTTTITVTTEDGNKTATCAVTVNMKWRNPASNSQDIFGNGTYRQDSRICAIAYGNGKFVAVSYSGKMATSTDGTTWTDVSESTFIHNYAIAYGNGKFVTVGEEAGILTSTDGGETWSYVDTGSIFYYVKSGYAYYFKAPIRAIAYGNGKFVAGDEEGVIAYSLW